MDGRIRPSGLHRIWNPLDYEFGPPSGTQKFGALRSPPNSGPPVGNYISAPAWSTRNPRGKRVRPRQPGKDIKWIDVYIFCVVKLNMSQICKKFAYFLPPRSILKTTKKKQLTLINKISRRCRYSEYQWFSDKPLHIV